MNTPSPLQPMGRLPEAGSGKSSFNLAVIGIVALHVVFFGGLLLQGCTKRTPDTADLGPGPGSGLGLASPTNAAPTDPLAGYGQPYGDPTNLAGYTPPPAPNLSFTNPAPQPTNLWAGTTPSNDPAFAEPIVPAATPAKEYVVVKGDTPAGIAKKHGISLDQLREANPGMDDRRLQISQKLQVPAPAPKDVAAVAPGAVDPAAPAPQVYVVKAGDNLNRIAARHGTTVKELRAFNNLKTDRIVVNQKIKIPPAKAKAAPAPTT